MTTFLPIFILSFSPYIVQRWTRRIKDEEKKLIWAEREGGNGYRGRCHEGRRENAKMAKKWKSNRDIILRDDPASILVCLVGETPNVRSLPHRSSARFLGRFRPYEPSSVSWARLLTQPAADTRLGIIEPCNKFPIYLAHADRLKRTDRNADLTPDAFLLPEIMLRPP